jgi:ribosomal protein L13
LKDVLPYLYRVSVAQRGTAARLAVAVAFMMIQKARPISHWSPYDRVGVVNADP